MRQREGNSLMSVYAAFVAKSFRKHLAYRSEVWVRIVISLVWVGIQVAIWRALIGDGRVEGSSQADMITYAIINTVLALVLMERALTDVDQKIRSGDIAVDLIKPVQYPLTVFADQLGRSAFQALFSVIPTVVLAALFFGFQLPASPANAIAFLASMVIALAISFAFGCLIVLLAFWFLATFHFQWAFGAFKTLFAGSLVPLWFYPDTLRTAARLLPFQFLGFFPAATWMGQLSTTEILTTLGLGIVWAGVLLGLASWMWSSITHRLVVQGG